MTDLSQVRSNPALELSNASDMDERCHLVCDMSSGQWTDCVTHPPTSLAVTRCVCSEVARALCVACVPSSSVRSMVGTRKPTSACRMRSDGEADML